MGRSSFSLSWIRGAQRWIRDRLHAFEISAVFSKQNIRAASALAAFGSMFWWLFPNLKANAQIISKELFVFLVALCSWFYQEATAHRPTLGKHDQERLKKFLWQYEYTLKPILRDYDMLNYIPEEVWDRFAGYFQYITSEQGEFIDRKLRQKFTPFQEKTREFRDHFALHGGMVRMASGQMMMSIRQQNELGGGLFSNVTQSEGEASNNLATHAFAEAKYFREYIRDNYSNVFDEVSYDHSFEVYQGGFLYTPYKKE